MKTLTQIADWFRKNVVSRNTKGGEDSRRGRRPDKWQISFSKGVLQAYNLGIGCRRYGISGVSKWRWSDERETILMIFEDQTYQYYNIATGDESERRHYGSGRNDYSNPW